MKDQMRHLMFLTNQTNNQLRVLAVLILVALSSTASKAQDSGSTNYAVGRFNAPEIKLAEYKQLDFALRKSLSDTEYMNLGTGLVLITVDLEKNGKIKYIKSIEYRGIKLDKLNDDIFKLNLKKYLVFDIPEQYKEVDSLRTTVIYKK